MLEINVRIDSEEALRELRSAARAMARPEMRAAIAVGVKTVVRLHIASEYGSYQNRLGGTSTQYYARMADSVTASATGTGVKYEIPFPGAALHYYGGTVRPSGRLSTVTGRPIRFLTIPMHPAAHGRRAADFRALYAVKGGLRLQQGAVKSPADPLYFVFARSATIRPDPNLLPPPEAIREVVEDAIEDTLADLRPAGGDRRRYRGGR